MEMELEEIPECCGSGCTNCVLDEKCKISAVDIEDKPSIFDTNCYHPFRCDSIAQCSPNTFRFRFKFHCLQNSGTDDKLLVIPAGTHLMIRAPIGWPNDRRILNSLFQKWRKHASASDNVAPRVPLKRLEKHDQTEENLYFSRPYTPIKANREEKWFDVLVKLEPHGEMSEFLQTLDVGALTEWKGVYGSFSWSRNRRKNLIGFAQGVGLAPIYSIMTSILEDEVDETRLHLIYCCKDVENILLRNELLRMATYWNFKCEIYLSGESCECGGKSSISQCLSSRKKYNETIFNHRLTKLDIENLLLKITQNSSQVLVCGTEAFTSLIETCITDLNTKDFYKF
ncbi:NADH-cytochrome b5 reductase-like [Uranotaenia lowii]|uniref:NADH-cytochrome b5 reductase-like n=1 Tax=Uranotaenia lowii TaxID=190385 RepID=UPI00247ACB76|nr:NADH-cytochrome b5 reductase-like [Uranotaenia lowii]